MDRLFVFDLRFDHPSSVEEAFSLASRVQAIDSCIVQPEELKIRLVATRRAGTPLLERIYERGGLAFCKQYLLGKPSSGQAGRRTSL